MYAYLIQSLCFIAAASLPLISHTARNFEYEYLLLASYCLLASMTFAALFLPNHLLPRDGDGRYAPPLAFELLWVSVISPLIMLLPAFTAFSFNFCQCSSNGYIFWFVLQLLPAIALAHACYAAIVFARCRETSRPWLIAGLICIFVTLLGYAGVRFWITPQAHLNNLLLGFIHGPIYDSWIPVDNGIVLARLAHFAAATSLLFFCWSFVSRRFAFVTAGSLVATLTFSYLAGKYPSSSRGRHALESQLDQSLKGHGFTLHFSNNDRTYAQQLFYEAEFHTQELTQLMATTLPHVHIYLYPDQHTKKLWFGGGATDVADVYTPSIHISAYGSPHPTLRHELVHALASRHAFYGLGFHPNMLFTEGLAVALAPEERDFDVHQGVAELYASKRMPAVSKLFSPLFWQESGDRAYTVAGSIVKYLINKYGTAAVLKLYNGESWLESFGQNKNTVLRGWKKFIISNYDVRKSSLQGERMFRYPGVFYDVCPHTKADYSQPRQHSIYTRLRQPSNWRGDDDLLAWLNRLDPQNKGFQLRHFRHKARTAYANKDNSKLLIREIEAGMNWPPKFQEDLELALLVHDLRSIHGEFGAAQKQLANIRQVVSKSSSHDQTLLRALDARQQLHNLKSFPAKMAWFKFVSGFSGSNLPPEDKQENAWILTYLRLRNASDKYWDWDRVQSLQKIKIPNQVAPDLTKEWYRLYAKRAFQHKLYDLALQATNQASRLAKPGEKEFYQLETRRIKYRSSH